MSEKGLRVEFEYTWDQIVKRMTQIRNNLYLIKNGHTIVTPIWRLNEDLNLLIERLQMIQEEQQYRAIP